MNLEPDILRHLLLTLLEARCPLAERTVKSSLRAAFHHVAFTDAQLVGFIRQAEESKLITGHRNPVLGTMWGLTDQGISTATQL